MSVNVAIAGATGAVGQEFLTVLAEREFPIRTSTAGQQRSAGKTLDFAGETYTVEEMTKKTGFRNRYRVLLGRIGLNSRGGGR